MRPITAKVVSCPGVAAINRADVPGRGDDPYFLRSKNVYGILADFDENVLELFSGIDSKRQYRSNRV